MFYFSGIWTPRLTSPSGPLPNVRVVRSILVTDENHPAVDLTHMVMQWGQFIDHDLTHVISNYFPRSQLHFIIIIFFLYVLLVQVPVFRTSIDSS